MGIILDGQFLSRCCSYFLVSFKTVFERASPRLLFSLSADKANATKLF